MRVSIFSFLFTIEEEELTRSIRQEANKRNTKWKEMKVSIIAEDVIQHINNTKDSTRKLL